MARDRATHVLGFAILHLFCVLTVQVHGSDPELTTDFKVPRGINASALNGTFFTFTGLRDVKSNPAAAPSATPFRADVGNFPALDGLGISSTLLVFPPGTVNVPHSHPRGTELVFLLEGTIDIGFVDTSNTLRTQTLYKGDLFVVPKDLVHFQLNRYDAEARTYNSFSSSNPGVVRMPVALFGSGIADEVLEKSFGVSADIIDQLQAAQRV